MIKAMTLKERNLDSLDERRKYVVTVVGCGRMGLPTACLFSDAGFNVKCLDADPYIVNEINRGTSPFVEQGLSQLLKKNFKKGRIAATTAAKEAIPESDIIIFTVNTPVDRKKRPDYSNLEESCRQTGLNLKPGTLVIVESTVGPYITGTLVKETLETASGLEAGNDFGLAYSPIRASVGRVIEDITGYAKIVAAIDKQSLTAAKAVLRTVAKGKLVEVGDMKTAEAVKLFENVYRDVSISLANEFAKFCERAGIDYIEARRVANTQPYCHLLKPGIVSGHIPKDPYLLISEAENLGIKLKMTALARRINDETVKHAYNLVKNALHSYEKPVKRSRVAVIGVSYRPNVKEANGSLVPDLVRLLRRRGARVTVFDPFFTHKELMELGYPAERTLGRTVEGTDCLVIAVGHSRFRRLGLRKIKVLMKKPAALVDLAQVVSPSRAEKEGFVYRGLGRGVWQR
ncbi:MAG: nucleotide sugar dehydrogenase [Candidatus Bathyarchaeota archaeon]|nr:nucleotide sugar dehydrogenase [Candidatus Bathyarchaeota archaeon]